MRWTTGMNRILYDHGNEGVDAVRKMLREAYHVRVSNAAIQKHASRIGASLRKLRTCAKCGHVGPPEQFARDRQMCRKCNAQYLAEKARMTGASLDPDEMARAKREYDRVRQENHRRRNVKDGVN